MKPIPKPITYKNSMRYYKFFHKTEVILEFNKIPFDPADGTPWGEWGLNYNQTDMVYWINSKGKNAIF